MVICFDLSSVSLSSGVLEVIVDPAPVVAPAPIRTGATIMVPEPMDAPSSMNVGAGSITCNYDGANKWPTYIDDGASIGSGTMMVAPVRIGAGTTVGAGSTITSSTAENKLVLERSKQLTKDGWIRPAKLDEKQKAAVIEKATQKPKV